MYHYICNCNLKLNFDFPHCFGTQRFSKGTNTTGDSETNTITNSFIFHPVNFPFKFSPQKDSQFQPVGFPKI